MARIRSTVNKETNRPNCSERGYTHAWHLLRNAFLRANPLCAICNRRGIVTAANCVDHIIAHKGNRELFWDTTNLQSLCTPCHNSKTGSKEVVKGYDVAGFPIDTNHPWLMNGRDG